MKFTAIGLDIAKNVFHVYGITEAGEIVKKALRRKQVLEYFAQVEPGVVGLESCGSAHFWARELAKLGHEAKLINPRLVKPYVKGNKNDFNDAEAIFEAVTRPNMRFVAVKTVEQQDLQVLHRIRQSLVASRTALVNQIRGLLSEYGIVIGKGINQVRKSLPEILEDGENGLTALGRELFAERYDQLKELDRQISEQDQRIERLAQQNALSRRLIEIPGIGPVTATAVAADIGEGKPYRNGRDYAASLGIVPRQHSSGGKSQLLGISKRGNRYLRTLLIHGARAVLNTLERKTDPLSRWLKALKQRRGANIAAVALANKNARIIWALANSGASYRPAVVTA
jgi:transposase